MKGAQACIRLFKVGRQELDTVKEHLGVRSDSEMLRVLIRAQYLKTLEERKQIELPPKKEMEEVYGY